jgi:hypothetical protein
MTVHGVKVPLQPDRSNDAFVGGVLDTHFILGATRDVTVHEIV